MTKLVGHALETKTHTPPRPSDTRDMVVAPHIASHVGPECEDLLNKKHDRTKSHFLDNALADKGVGDF